jgi:hypothetical protein
MSPAPKGNQFWKLRSKHGRDKLFATADLLWEAACEYFEWCDEHPWMKVEQARAAGKPGLAIKTQKGKVKDIQATRPAELAELPTQRPYTLTGLCLYLGCSQSYFYDFKDSKPTEDFSEIITRIEHTIETQQFEGATVGAYNANIVARKLGLADNQKIDQKSVVEYKNVSKQFPDE